MFPSSPLITINNL